MYSEEPEISVSGSSEGVDIYMYHWNWCRDSAMIEQLPLRFLLFSSDRRVTSSGIPSNDRPLLLLVDRLLRGEPAKGADDTCRVFISIAPKSTNKAYTINHNIFKSSSIFVHFITNVFKHWKE